MGNLRSSLEQFYPRTGEYVGRYEDRWKYERLTGQSLIFTPELSRDVRVVLVHELSRKENGKDVEPYSADENERLTIGLRNRFALWKAHSDEIRSFDLDSDHPDFTWQQTRLDEIDLIMQGYVNLVCAVNFDQATHKDKTNEARVEDFLADYEDAIITVFESNGGASIFRAKTEGLDPRSVIGSRIFSELQLSNLGIDPSTASLNGPDFS